MRAFCDDDDLTKEEKWAKNVGTTSYGNLPEYKCNEHEGHSYAPCPYSTQATDKRTRHLLGISTSGTLPTKVSHVDGDGRIYYMKTFRSGGWGYECTYSGCPYLLSEGKPYFFK